MKYKYIPLKADIFIHIIAMLEIQSMTHPMFHETKVRPPLHVEKMKYDPPWYQQNTHIELWIG